jgi:hypothetical protein
MISVMLRAGGSIAGSEIDPERDYGPYRTAPECVDAAAAGATDRSSYFYERCFLQPIGHQNEP